MSKKELIKCIFQDNFIITEDSDNARDLYSQNTYGSVIPGGKIQLSLYESLFLVEKGKISILNSHGKEYVFEKLITKFRRIEKNFWIKYCVFKDFRERGYIIKTALKFGGDFRVYDRGIKPGEDHAKWIVFPVHENANMTWHDYAAKNRVAHSTKKRLLLAIVDEESKITYYENRWVRP